jgi:hypothetical protein
MKKNNGAEINAKIKKTLPIPKKARGKGKPFPPGNPYRFPPGKSPNPGGKPREFKLLSEAYAQLMRETCPLDTEKRTWGEVVAEGMLKAARTGNPAAAKEIRQAIEGDKVKSLGWQDDVIQALKDGSIKVKDVIHELGEDVGKPLILAAGLSSSEGGEITHEETKSE